MKSEVRRANVLVRVSPETYAKLTREAEYRNLPRSATIGALLAGITQCGNCKKLMHNAKKRHKDHAKTCALWKDRANAQEA